MNKWHRATLSCIWIVCAPAYSAGTVGQADVTRLTVHSSRVIGSIEAPRDLGVGRPLMRDTVDLTTNYKQLGVRNIRLRDVPWVYVSTQSSP